METREHKLPTEDGIDNMVCRLERGGEVVNEGDVKVLELLGKTLRTRISRLKAEQ